MKSKKIALGIISLFLFLVGGYIAMRYFDFFNWYSPASSAMRPTFNKGDLVFASRVPGIQNGDIVVYRAVPLAWEQTHEKYIAVGRLIASEADTLVIKNGLCYVNSRMIDDTNNLAYFFAIWSVDAPSKIPAAYKEEAFAQMADSVFMGDFTYEELRKFGLESASRRYIINSGDIDPRLFNVASDLKWSMDNMGPIIVPKNSYFIMGDNRGNSMDCRYRGFVTKENLISKVVN